MLRHKLSLLLCSLALTLLLPGTHARASASASRWIASWTAMPQLTEPGNLPNPPFNQSGLVFPNSTIRQTLHLSLGGPSVRIRVSNAFGTSDLSLTSAAIALPVNGSAGVAGIVPGSSKKLTFSGQEGFVIPTGSYVVSDPVEMDVDAQSIVSVSFYLEDGQASPGNAVTSHPGSRTTSWFTFGDQLEDDTLTGESLQSVAHWYFISTIETLQSPSASAIAIVGDSITDGRGSTTDANNRWPDELLARLQGTFSGTDSSNATYPTNSTGTASPFTKSLSVLNQAAGGNRILADGLGPNAFSRIDRDVFSQPGVKYVMIFEGVNDIGVASADVASQQDIGDRVISAFKQIVLKSHALGLPVIGCTITPFSAPANSTIQPYSDPEREKTRQRVNAFIRGEGNFDGVVDFAEAVRDPDDASMLSTGLDSGDYLHLNPEGYRVMAEAVDLGLFERLAGGVWG